MSQDLKLENSKLKKSMRDTEAKMRAENGILKARIKFLEEQNKRTYFGLTSLQFVLIRFKFIKILGLQEEKKKKKKK